MSSSSSGGSKTVTVDDLSTRDEALLATVEEIIGRNQHTGWHLDKKVPISIIFTILMQAVAGLWFIAQLRTDIELLKSAKVEQRDRDERQDKTLTESLALIRADLQKVNDKLDRLIEKGQR